MGASIRPGQPGQDARRGAEEDALADARAWEQFVDSGLSEQAATAEVEKRRKARGVAPAAGGVAPRREAPGALKSMALNFVSSAPFMLGDEAIAAGATARDALAGRARGGVGARYAANKAALDTLAADASRAHPNASGAGSLAGMLAAPAGAALKEGTLMAKIAANAGSGALAAGMAGAGQSDGSRIRGGLTAAAIGGPLAAVAAPVGQLVGRRVGQALGAGTAAVLGRGAQRTARLVGEDAEEMLLRALQDDGLSPGMALSKLQQMRQAGLKPETILEMGGRNVQGLARGARAAGGAAKDAIDESLDARHMGGLSRVIDDAMREGGQSGRVNSFAHIDDLDAARAKAAEPLYDKAYARGAVSDPAVLEHARLLEELIPSAKANALKLAKAKRLAPADLFQQGLDAEGNEIAVPTVRYLDFLKRGVDDALHAGKRSALDAGGLGPDLDRSIRAVKNDMLAALDIAVPEYGAARADYAGRSAVLEAFDLGRDLYAKSPTEVQHLMRAWGSSEREAFRKGAVEALAGKAESATDGANLERTLAGRDVMRQRVRLMFAEDQAGEEAYGRFLDLLKREGAMARTRGQVTGNSQTADKLEELARLAEDDVPAEAMMAAATGNVGNLAMLAARGLQRAKGAATKRARADALARPLTAGAGGNPAELQTLLQRLFDTETRVAEREAGRATRRNVARAGLGVAAGAAVGSQTRKDRR